MITKLYKKALVAGGGWQRPKIDEFIGRHDLGNNIIMLGEVFIILSFCSFY